MTEALVVDDSPAFLAFAKWLAKDLSGKEMHEASLQQEVVKLQDAVSCGAAGILELRQAVQDQLADVVKRIVSIEFRAAVIEENLADTKRDLAEMLIEEEHTARIDARIDKLEEDLDLMQGNFATMHQMHQGFEVRAREQKQATDKQIAAVRQQLESAAPRAEVEHMVQQGDVRLSAVQKSLEERMEERVGHLKRETHGQFKKLDDTLCARDGVMAVLDRVRRKQETLDSAVQESAENVKRGSNQLATLEDHVRQLMEDFTGFKDAQEMQLRSLQSSSRDDGEIDPRKDNRTPPRSNEHRYGQNPRPHPSIRMVPDSARLGTSTGVSRATPRS
mmetsp:Transcript_45030/g.104299  ORF Transcript_45030/g.104299 Transcript_45030/m.104299 type:complete len:333 (-) Transcript_45030:28-1026(-)